MIAFEPESRALRAFLGRYPERVTSTLSIVEVGRAIRRLGAPREREAGEVLERTGLIPMDQAILESAANVGLKQLRALDAIHLATAIALRPDLEGLVSYDSRLSNAAAQLKLKTFTPS